MLKRILTAAVFLSGISTAQAADTIRYELEGMTLTDFFTERKPFSSKGAHVRMGYGKASGTKAVAKRRFKGPDGRYEIVIRYFDENDGNSVIRVNVGKKRVKRIVLNRSPGGIVATAKNSKVRILRKNFLVRKGDPIKVVGVKRRKELTRIDYIEFRPVQIFASLPDNDLPVGETTGGGSAGGTDNTSDGDGASGNAGTDQNSGGDSGSDDTGANDAGSDDTFDDDTTVDNEDVNNPEDFEEETPIGPVFDPDTNALKASVGSPAVYDITEAPYNAACNGSADDSAAFEKAVDDGGRFYLPPGSRCVLKSTSLHPWKKNVTFFGAEDARENTHIDISSGGNFELQNGASVGLYNLSFKNGGDFIVANGSLAGAVPEFVCQNNVWENVKTWCLRWSDNSENANGKITRLRVSGNQASLGADGEGLYAFGGMYEDVQIINNFQRGGKRGVQLGFSADSDTAGEVNERRSFLISGNVISDIDGNNTSGGVVVSCIYASGRNITISENVCSNIYDQNEANTGCIYTKAQHVAIRSNSLSDCGARDGAIVVAGYDEDVAIESCTQGHCARQSVIANNSVRNTDFGLKNYSCVWVQSQNAIVSGNQLDGCTDAAVEVAQGGTHHNVIITGNQVHNHAGDAAFLVHGNKQNIVIAENTVYRFNSAETNMMLGVDLYVEDGEQARAIKIADNRFYFPKVNGTTTVGVNVETVGSGSIEDLEVTGNFFEKMDSCIVVDSGSDIKAMTVGMNQMHRCTKEYSLLGGGRVVDGFAYDNRGWSGSF